MEMREPERKYLIALMIVFIVLFAAAIGSLIAAFIIIYHQQSILNNLLELIYLAVHIVATVLGGYMCYSALKSKKGSFMMRGLMIHSSHKKYNKPARIIAIILCAFSFAIGVYFTLVLCGVPLYAFHFPIALVLDLVNSPFSVFIVGLFFIFYPNVYLKCRYLEAKQ